MRRGLVVALAVAAAGAGLAWTASPPGTPFAPGVVILAVAAALVALSRSRVAVAVGVAGVLLVLARLVGAPEQLLDPSGDYPLAVSAGRWVQGVSVLAALVAAVVLARRPPSPAPAGEPTGARARGRAARLGQVAALVVLSGICAEILQAYDDNTGRPGALVPAIAFFAALYGGPALLIREVARHAGRGWPSMLLGALAFGLLQPGVIDQSMFTEDYRDIPCGMRPRHRRT